MNFNTNTWMKNQYLKEAGLQESLASQAATAIDKVLDEVDPSGILPEDLGAAIAIIVKNGYQAELQKKFMDVLQAELGMEPLNEDKTPDIETIDLEYTDREGLFRKARVYYKDGSMDSFFGAQFDKFLNNLGINQEFDKDTDEEIIKSLKDKNIKITFSEKDVS